MSHLEKILDETFGKKKPKQVEVAVERLHPPMAPKPIVSETAVVDKNRLPSAGGIKDEEIPPHLKGDDSKLAIDYETIARSSEFQRFIYFVLTGKTHRGKQRDLKRDVTVKMNKFRGSGMGAVINEFKDKVAKLQEKRVE